MNNQDILDYVNYVANKEQSGRTLTPAQFNDVLTVANLKYTKRSYGFPEDYLPQGPFNKEVYEKTQYVTDKMRRFKTVMGDHNNVAMTVDAFGVATIPTNYFHVSSIRFANVTAGTCDPSDSWVAVEILDDAQWADRLGNSIMAPSLSNPVAMFQANEIWFRPKTLKYVQFTYLRYPTTPVYAYTIGANDQVIYDSANSTELEWDDIEKVDIANIILTDIGINLKETQIAQYAELLKEKGT